MTNTEPSQPSIYSAFVYIWTNLENRRLGINPVYYLGVHTGPLDENLKSLDLNPYICSQKSFKLEYKKNPSNFKRTIIARGNSEDMFLLENQILVANNAKDNPAFYNQCNGYSKNGHLSGLPKGYRRSKWSNLELSKKLKNGRKSIETRRKLCEAWKIRRLSGESQESKRKRANTWVTKRERRTLGIKLALISICTTLNSQIDNTMWPDFIGWLLK